MVGMIYKTEALRSTALRKSAKGQPCTVRLPHCCNHNPETTVLAHLPGCGSGMGHKASDDMAVYACSACHDALDGRRQDIAVDGWDAVRALSRTREIQRRDGLVTYKGAK